MKKDEVLRLLQLAQAALNTAPRFKVPSLPKEHDDSYKVAAQIDKAIRDMTKKKRAPHFWHKT